jgi:hypothetical protein
MFEMASHDKDLRLFRQYVELSKTSPRQMAQHAPQSEQAPAEGRPKDQAEAEWSLRRIERRVGSIA